MSALAGQELCLGGLSARLTAAGYDVANMLRVLGRGVLGINPDLLPGLARRCRDDATPAARLTAFWLLLEPAGEADLHALLGRDVVEALAMLDLIAHDGSQVRARASLYPCLGRHFFAEPVLNGTGSEVSWLDEAGYALALATPRPQGQRALHLGSGCGANTILNAGHNEQSWGVDEVPGALKLGRVNALVNGLEARCHFVASTSELPAGEYDLITGRMPFAPPSSGEDALIVRDAAARLRVRGTMAMAVRHFTPDDPLLDRVERWLGGGEGWGLAQLSCASRFLNDDVTRPPSPEELQFDLAGFECAAEALVFVRRLDGGRRSWRAEAAFSRPANSASDEVGQWLDAQEPLSVPVDGRPRWACTSQLFVDTRSGVGMVRFNQDCFPADVLDPADAFLLGEVDGQKTVGDLVESCARRWQKTVEAARPEVDRRLRALRKRALIGGLT